MQASKQTCSKSGGIKWLCLLFFHRDGDRADRGEPYLVAFNASDQAAIDIVVMALVRSFTAILLCQLDPVALNLVDSAYVNAVGADDFHVLFDIGHGQPFEHCCGVVTSVLSRQFLFGLDVDERFRRAW